MPESHHLLPIVWSTDPYSGTLWGVQRGLTSHHSAWHDLAPAWRALRNDRYEWIALHGQEMPLSDWTTMIQRFAPLSEWTTESQWALWQAQWQAARQGPGHPIPLWQTDR